MLVLHNIAVGVLRKWLMLPGLQLPARSAAALWRWDQPALKGGCSQTDDHTWCHLGNRHWCLQRSEESRWALFTHWYASLWAWNVQQSATMAPVPASQWVSILVRLSLCMLQRARSNLQLAHLQQLRLRQTRDIANMYVLLPFSQAAAVSSSSASCVQAAPA